MAINLVTGKAGTPHVSSEDIGAWQGALCGWGAIQLPDTRGQFPACALSGANRVVVPAADFLIDGRLVRVTSQEQAVIESGVSGDNRIDLVCLQYSKDAGTGVEAMRVTVVKGAPVRGSAPQLPAVAAGRITSGAQTATYPVCSVQLNGVSPQQPVMLARKGIDPSPPGAIQAHVGAAEPPGWLFCRGQVLDRAPYAALADALGVPASDRQFTLPDLQGRVLLGAGPGYALGSQGGQNNTTITVDNLPPHKHDVVGHGMFESGVGIYQSNVGSGGGWWIPAGWDGSGSAWLETSLTGKAAPMTNLPKYLAVNWIIRC